MIKNAFSKMFKKSSYWLEKMRDYKGKICRYQFCVRISPSMCTGAR